MSLLKGNPGSGRIARILGAVVLAAVLFAELAFLRPGPAPAKEGAGPLSVRAIAPPAWMEPRPAGDGLLAKGKFLVASSTITDIWFRETVVLLIGYDATGASGLIINRPTKVALAELLPSFPGLKNRSDVVYYGGPVEAQRAFLLIRSDAKPEDSDSVFSNVYVSMSRSTLERAINEHKTQKQMRVYSGYAGWFPGQLEKEVSRGDWYVMSADEDTVFDMKESEIWRELIRRGSSIETRQRDLDVRS